MGGDNSGYEVTHKFHKWSPVWEEKFLIGITNLRHSWQGSKKRVLYLDE